ncbi:MAG: DUF5916 domain-containing protein [Myxococcaceae bacterium]
MRACLALILALTTSALAGDLVASRTEKPIRLDGILDEQAWTTALGFTHFVESFPKTGAPPDLSTEARVLYDRDFLYIGIHCSDPTGQLARQLGRRDSTPASDRIEVAIDSALDGRTAYAFTVNVAGVLRDRLFYGNVNFTESWDAVWDARTKETADGWSVELALPLRAFRFSSASDQSWGLLIRRFVPRTRQVFDSTLVPRDLQPFTPGELVVSRFGRLHGLKDLHPGRPLELLPYLGARATLRPQYSTQATPLLLDPSLNLGLDFRLALTGDLTLTGAVNPDFGQVEADELIQNLQNAEPFFPEKRPFFLQGLDVFTSVGAEYGVPQQIFYSRRIGLTAPILGAVKLAGTVREGLEIGLLDALVMGAGNLAASPVGYGDLDSETLEGIEANPDRRWRFRLRQPFYFGPEDALPLAHPVSTNYLAAVARQRLGRTSVGAIFTAATPLEPRCRPTEFPNEETFLAARCESRGGNVLGFDLNTRDSTGEWGGFAQLSASQEVGGAGRLLTDGTQMRPGDLGLGGYLRFGKLGGEPFRFDISYVFEDPKLNLNAVGFQPLSNYQWVDLMLRYVRPNGVGKLRSFSVDYLLDLNWTADGKWLPRGINTNVRVKAQLPSFDTVGFMLGLELPQYETREIQYAGVPFERLGDAFGTLFWTSDVNRRLFATGELVGGFTIPHANRQPTPILAADLEVTWRPIDWLETKLEASAAHKLLGPRWVETGDDNLAVFGEQDPAFLSITLREQVVITPRLTAQLYAQLFSESIRYGSFFSASLTGRDRLQLAELTPYAYSGQPFSHGSQLNLNAVLRWEYGLGSTLFFVYTRSQTEPVSDSAPASVLPSRLFAGPVSQTFLVKWSYWWG